MDSFDRHIVPKPAGKGLSLRATRPLRSFEFSDVDDDGVDDAVNKYISLRIVVISFRLASKSLGSSIELIGFHT